MLGIMYTLIKDFGGVGVGLASIALNGFLFWKLFTNHLRHIAMQIEEVSKDVNDVKKEQSGMKERISKIEGQLS